MNIKEDETIPNPLLAVFSNPFRTDSLKIHLRILSLLGIDQRNNCNTDSKKPTK